MLTLFKSSELKQLAGKLLAVLGEKKSNPLQPEFIILQNNGMKRWLQQFIAREQGIAANIKTEFPGAFIWNVYHQIDDNLPEILPCEKEPMQWAVLDILLSRKHKKVLQPLYRYIHTDIEGGTAQRAWNLSVRIADLFDRYQIYRPKMILKWQKGKRQTTSRDEKWQAALWNILQKRWDNQLENINSKNRVELHQSFLEAVQHKTPPLDLFPDPLNIFAIDEPAPMFLEAFVQLSSVIDVNYYWLNSIQSEDNEHSLIESWGKRGRDFLNLLDKLVSEDEIDYIIQSVGSQNKRADGDKLLLHKLQNHIINGKIDSEERDYSNDHSVQVHSCHSPVREVEALHDQLLALFDENPNLKPEEVAVVNTDPELYAPLFEAVFRSKEENIPEIPFTVTGVKGRQRPEIRSFIKILELLQSRFKLSDVMALLRMPVIRQKLNITYDDVVRLEKWVEDNNIRRDIDGAFKEQFDLPGDDHFTWKAGLSRMLLGYAMQPDGQKLYEGMAVYDKISGSDNAELLGTFCDFLHTVFGFHGKVQSSKTPDGWVYILNEIIYQFLLQNPHSDFGIEQLKEAVQQLKEEAAAGHLKQKLSFDLVQRYIKNKFEKIDFGGSYGSGLVFSTPVGVQRIPFKVIGFLGMDEGSFPGIDSKTDFDLMEHEALKGDPDQTEKQRYLLLNALLSSRETFYVSYTGQSNRTEEREAPSVLVSELLNVTEETFGVKKEAIVTEHRLQPFSPRYFQSDSGLFSYSNNHYKTAKKLVELVSMADEAQNTLFDQLPSPEVEKVELDDLVAFYKHPAKYVLQNRLGIYLKDEQATENEREIFALNGLEKYQLRQELLEHCLEDRDIQSLQNFYKARDMLPAYMQGNRAFQQEAENVQSFYSKISDKIGNRREIEIELKLANSVQFEGTMSEICDDSLLLFRFGRLRAKDATGWWIKHIVWNAINKSDGSGTSNYYSYEKKYGKYKVQKLVLDEVENASKILNSLVDYFITAQGKPLPFFPKTSFAFAEALHQGDGKDEALEKAKSVWEGNKYSYDDDSEDAYNRMLFKNFDVKKRERFEEISIVFFEPYFEALKD